MKTTETNRQKRSKQKVVNYKSVDDALKAKHHAARQAIADVVLPESWIPSK